MKISCLGKTEVMLTISVEFADDLIGDLKREGLEVEVQ